MVHLYKSDWSNNKNSTLNAANTAVCNHQRNQKRLKHLNPNMAILMMISIIVLHLRMRILQHKTNVLFHFHSWTVVPVTSLTNHVLIQSNKTWTKNMMNHLSTIVIQSKALTMAILLYHYLHIVNCLRTSQDWW